MIPRLTKYYLIKKNIFSNLKCINNLDLIRSDCFKKTWCGHHRTLTFSFI